MVQTAATRRISPLRLLAVVLVTAVLVGGASLWAVDTVAAAFATPSPVSFTPYVDVTLTPTAHFEDPVDNVAHGVVLGFVVADPDDGCQPTWGTFYDLDAAGRALDLDRRIAGYRERGGDIGVSFGGFANDELATTCTDVDDLAAAYRTVVDRHGLSLVDFDVEGEALADTAANERRAQAIAMLQSDLDLEVWLTVPVARSGMTDEGVALVDATLAAGVDLAGVNAMTMNLGVDDATSMGDASVEALEGVRRQVQGAWQRAGMTISAEDAWTHVGATPMIGQNDIPTEVFTLADAERVSSFAASVGIDRISSWSLNRDDDCGAVDTAGQVSNTCSGVAQDTQGFAAVFMANDHAAPVTSDEARARAVSRDDPATSPYPIWRATRAYEQGEKVVWHGSVYEAKWWAEAVVPDAPVAQEWESPWRYLGPVMAVDGEILEAARVTVSGTWATWGADEVYVEGDEVSLDGEVYRARWWTQGDQPELDPDRPFDNPWEHVGAAEDDADVPAEADVEDAAGEAPVTSPDRDRRLLDQAGLAE